MSHASAEPSAWVERFAPLIPAGRVLDLACGAGRHARLLAAMGHDVVAVDRDAAALATLAGERIEGRLIDLEQSGAEQQALWPLVASMYSGVVVANYLHRALMSALLASVKSGGILIYETFAHGNGQFGKPSNPDFLLARGELLDVGLRAPAWHVIAFEDGYVETPKPAMIQRVCARREGAATIPICVAL